MKHFIYGLVLIIDGTLSHGIHRILAPESRIVVTEHRT